VKRTYSRHGAGDHQNHELTYWCEKLSVPREQLRKAVIEKGTMRKAVESHRSILVMRRKGPLRLKIVKGRLPYHRD
jgi:hypothetical protein